MKIYKLNELNSKARVVAGDKVLELIGTHGSKPVKEVEAFAEEHKLRFDENGKLVEAGDK